MRQQLISWLIEDIAPEIRRSRDPAGEILKFANTNNLAPALVQSLGQLYNTAKTLAFLEKNASNRGESFPILDVEQLVGDYLQVTPKAAAANIAHWELSGDQDGLDDLPSCFSGIFTPAVEEAIPLRASTEPTAKAAAAQEAYLLRELDMNCQLAAETEMEITKQADVIARLLRENPHYPFEQLDADTRYAYSDDPHMLGTLDKLAAYLGECNLRLPVKRASMAASRKLLNLFEEQMTREVSVLDDLFFRREAADATFKEASTTIPPEKMRRFIAGRKMMRLEDEIYNQEGEESPLPEAGTVPVSAPAVAGKSAPAPGRESAGAPAEKAKGDGGGQGQGQRGYFDRLSDGLDSVVSGGGRAAGGMLSGMRPDVDDQALVDNSARDVKHLALLQNLLTTDDILSEADPEQVVSLYGTIRENAPELAGDINVMRVLLRSAIQHDGIAPFDLKGILETEQAKQRVEMGRRETPRPQAGRPTVPALSF